MNVHIRAEVIRSGNERLSLSVRSLVIAISKGRAFNYGRRQNR